MKIIKLFIAALGIFALPMIAMQNIDTFIGDVKRVAQGKSLSELCKHNEQLKKDISEAKVNQRFMQRMKITQPFVQQELDERRSMFLDIRRDQNEFSKRHYNEKNKA